MPNPFNYSVPVPNIGPALSEITGAIDDRRERKRLSEIGGFAAEGRLSEASSAAFSGGDLKTGIAFADLDQERQANAVGVVGRMAHAADTPEKWNQFLEIATRRFPGSNLSEYQDFSSRDAVLAEFTDPYKEADLSLKNRRLALEERRFAGQGSKPPNIQTLYDEKTGREYKAQWNPQTEQYERVGGVKAPSGTTLQVGPDGEVSFTQGNVKPLTESQSKITGFATRMAGALPTIDAMGDALTSLPESVGSGVPAIGNYLRSPEFRQAEQAGEEFLQALLRKDSGAAIPPAEIEQYGNAYLPRPGDDPATLQQKKAARTRALLSVKLGMTPQQVLQIEEAKLDLPEKNPEPMPGNLESIEGDIDVDSLIKRYSD